MMKTIKTASFVLFCISMLTIVSCNKTKKIEIPFFPGEYPGTANANSNKKNFVLSNSALEAKWEVVEQTLVLSEVINKYDGEVINFDKITLFAIELENGKELTNRNFKIKDTPKISTIVASDSLPTLALRYPGKEISAVMHAPEENIIINWRARLRDGSNYVRQNIEIQVQSKPVKISKITFFDGKLEGAETAGLVVGSPITCNNFFFGFEQPLSRSDAVVSRGIAGITNRPVNVSKIIEGNGEYTVSVSHGRTSNSDGYTSKFNIESMALYEGENQLCLEDHPLNGSGGSSFYTFNVSDYDQSKEYTIRVQLTNPFKVSGGMHMHLKRKNILNFYVPRMDELVPGKSISEWAVIGVTPPNQERRGFLYYLERERARPYKQFLHYNCWYDLAAGKSQSFTSDQLIETMHAWNEKFIEPYGVNLNSFVFDDGWDNVDSLWYFDPVKFPEGFSPQAELCKKYNSGIGVWMSPFGGYLENKRKRLQSARREGLETNSKGLSLAGPNYYNRFLERSLDMLNNYKVNYFKYDGFGGYAPAYLPDMEAGARLIKTLRQHNPDVFVNITVGSWPSPFWLKYADCTWRGSGDLHFAGIGTRTQQFMTYRDGTLHNNVVKKSPLYPLNSIMTVGIAYAKMEYGYTHINDSIQDFSDMIWSYFGSGTSLQELYISHSRMKPEFWDILAKAAKWSKSNEHILYDTHWVGGSPINLEVYGFASWTPEKGIITLRNPSADKKTFSVDLKKHLEILPEYEGDYILKGIYNTNNSQENVNTNQKVKIQLEPFQSKVYELIPLR